MGIDKYILELEARLARMEQENKSLKNELKDLRLVEEKFSKAFRYNQAMMTISRLRDNNLISINREFTEVLGYEPGELEGQSVLNLNHWGNFEERQKLLQDLILYRCARNYKVTFRKKSGDIGFAIMSAVLVDINGEKDIICSAIDITEQKNAEDKLRASEEKFSKAFYKNQIPMIITRNKDGLIIDVNDRYLELLGYKLEDFIGKTVFDINLWGDITAREEMIAHINKEGCVKDYKTKFRTKSGEIGIMLSSISVLELEGERCFLVSSEDITEIIKSEEALMQSQRLWNQIFNSVPLPMTIRRIKDKKLLEVNDAYLTRYKIDRNDFLKERDSGIYSVPEPPWLNNVVPIVLENNIAKNYESTYQLPSGENTTVLVSGVRIFCEGEDCILNVANDITGLKSYEKEIKRLDALNLMGQMAGSIAHEVRNPMTSIKGFLQLFKSQYKYREDEEVIELMIEEIDRVNDIISAFLSLAHKNAIELKLQNLSQKVTNLLPLMMADAIKNDVYIDTELTNTSPILLDIGEFRQLLLNLAHNGIQAMLKGGTLRIKTFEDENGVNLVVEDEGKGIPQEIMDKIGTPFITTKKEGTGLGLAVCYSIAERHNAKITVDTSSEGTSFKVTFPVVA